MSNLRWDLANLIARKLQRADGDRAVDPSVIADTDYMRLADDEINGMSNVELLEAIDELLSKDEL